MNIVAENIKRILEDLGMKKKKAAELCGYTQNSFSSMLNGRKVIKTEDVIAICNGLHIMPNELYNIKFEDGKSA